MDNRGSRVCVKCLDDLRRQTCVVDTKQSHLCRICFFLLPIAEQANYSLMIEGDLEDAFRLWACARLGVDLLNEALFSPSKDIDTDHAFVRLLFQVGYQADPLRLLNDHLLHEAMVPLGDVSSATLVEMTAHVPVKVVVARNSPGCVSCALYLTRGEVGYVLSFQVRPDEDRLEKKRKA